MSIILVSGGAGFLGSNLCKRLLETTDNKIVCVDNLITGKYSNIANLCKYKNRFEFVESDIKYYTTDILFDEIYNAACPASPPKYQKNPIDTTLTCVLGTLNLLNIAKNSNAKFLQFSTSEIYGNPIVHPQKETYLGNVNTIGPRSCYDEGKRCAESICSDFKRKNPKMDIKIVRIFNTYGPNMDSNDGRVISNFVTQALQNKKITIYGDGTQTRSFCYVDDLITGLIKFMSVKDEFGPINLGNPREFTLNELVNLLSIIFGRDLDTVYLTLPQDDPIKRKPDISRAKKLLNWEPEIQLRDGLIKTIKYFKEEIKNNDN